MSDLVILRYTEETSPDLIYETFINLKKAVPNKTVIAIPYSIDILNNCSLEQLYEVKRIIDSAIIEREEKMKEIKMFCDKCAKEVDHLNYYTFPGYKRDIILGYKGGIYSQYIGDIKTDIDVEICDECVEKIRKEFHFHQS